jgi:hypothetical protein
VPHVVQEKFLEQTFAIPKVFGPAAEPGAVHRADYVPVIGSESFSCQTFEVAFPFTDKKLRVEMFYRSSNATFR